MERRIPARFGRLAMAFDEVATKFRPCESSGSEHSPDGSFTDLSDLVNSFLERDDGEINGCSELDVQKVLDRTDSDEMWSDSETKEELASLLGCDSDELRRKIRDDVENAMGFDGVRFEKRNLITRLRDRGLDAGICKSRWEKSGRIPAGDFEYMDVNMSNNTRYIVELNLVSHFEIARPTRGYMALLKTFPRVFVGKVEDLKRIVRIMCAAIKVSLKSAGLPVAPWRRNRYMQVKWFGSYKRTTNAQSAKGRAEESESKKLTFGFQLDGLGSSIFGNVYGCRSESQFKGIKQNRAKFGYLAAAFAGADGLKS